MLFKKKHITVILLSSIIISVIIVSTLGVYTIYISSKEELSKTGYRASIYSLTADIFREKIEILNIKTSVYEDDYGDKVPVLEGKIKNNSKKIITSMLIEIEFSKPDGAVVYRDWFSPEEEEALSKSPFFSSAKYVRLSLKPDNIISFRYLLRNSPQEVSEVIFLKESFAKAEAGGEIKLSVKVAGIGII